MAVAPPPKPSTGKEVGESREPLLTQTANMLPLTTHSQKQHAPSTLGNPSLPASFTHQTMEPIHSPTPALKSDCTTNQSDQSECRQVKRKRDGSFSDADEDNQSPRQVKAGRYFGALMIDAFDSEFEHVHQKARSLEDKLVAQQVEQKAACSTIQLEQVDIRSTLDKEIALREEEKVDYNRLQKEHMKRIKELKERIKVAEETTSGHKEQLASLEDGLKSKASLEALDEYVRVLSTKILELESSTQERAKQQSTEEQIRELVQNECVVAQIKIETSSAERIKAASDELEQKIETVHNKTRDDAILARKKEFALDARMNGYDGSLQMIHEDASDLKSRVDLHETQLMEFEKDKFLDGEMIEKLENTQKRSLGDVENLRTDIMAMQRTLNTLQEDISPISSQITGHTTRLDALEGSGAFTKLEKIFDDRMMKVKEDLRREFDERIEQMQKQHDLEKAALQQQHDSEKASQHAAMQATQEAMRHDKATSEQVVRAEVNAQREKDLESAKATSKKADKAGSASLKRVQNLVNEYCFEVETVKMGHQDDHTAIRHLQRTVETLSKGIAEVPALRSQVRRVASCQEKLVKDVDAQQQRINVVERDLSTSIADTRGELSTSIKKAEATLSSSINNMGNALSTAFRQSDHHADRRCSDRAREVKEGLDALSGTVHQVNEAYQALRMGLGGFMGTPLRPTAYPSPPPHSQPNSPALQVSTTPRTPCGPGPSPQQQFQQFQHSPRQLISPASPKFPQASPLSNAPAQNQPPGAPNMNSRPQAPEHRRTNSVPQVPAQHVLSSNASPDPSFNARQMQPPSPYMGSNMAHPHPGPPYRQ